jgi:hypothetical protein
LMIVIVRLAVSKRAITAAAGHGQQKQARRTVPQ